MTKKNKSDKVISIRVPEELFEKFKSMCDEHSETMSHALRSYIDFRTRLPNNVWFQMVNQAPIVN